MPHYLSFLALLALLPLAPAPYEWEWADQDDTELDPWTPCDKRQPNGEMLRGFCRLFVHGTVVVRTGSHGLPHAALAGAPPPFALTWSGELPDDVAGVLLLGQLGQRPRGYGVVSGVRSHSPQLALDIASGFG